MKKLYELADELQQLYIRWEEVANDPDLLEDEQEKQLASIEEDMDGWKMDLEVKAENIGKLIKNFQQEATVELAKAEPFMEQAMKHKNRARSLKNRVDRLREYLKVQLQRAAIDRIDGMDLSVRLMNNSRPTVTLSVPVEQIPQEFHKVHPPAADNTKILEAWKAGEEIPGTHVIRGAHVRVI